MMFDPSQACDKMITMIMVMILRLLMMFWLFLPPPSQAPAKWTRTALWSTTTPLATVSPSPCAPSAFSVSSIIFFSSSRKIVMFSLLIEWWYHSGCEYRRCGECHFNRDCREFEFCSSSKVLFSNLNWKFCNFQQKVCTFARRQWSECRFNRYHLKVKTAR